MDIKQQMRLCNTLYKRSYFDVIDNWNIELKDMNEDKEDALHSLKVDILFELEHAMRQAYAGYEIFCCHTPGYARSLCYLDHLLD